MSESLKADGVRGKDNRPYKEVAYKLDIAFIQVIEEIAQRQNIEPYQAIQEALLFYMVNKSLGIEKKPGH